MSCSVEQGQDREERGESICPAVLNTTKTERRVNLSCRVEHGQDR